MQDSVREVQHFLYSAQLNEANIKRNGDNYTNTDFMKPSGQVGLLADSRVA